MVALSLNSASIYPDVADDNIIILDDFKKKKKNPQTFE